MRLRPCGCPIRSKPTWTATSTYEQRRVADAGRAVADRLAKLANDRERLLDLYLDGILDKTTFAARQERIDSETRELQAQAQHHPPNTSKHAK
jgi:hypothetical protein